MSPSWWFISVVSAPLEQKEKVCNFEVSLGYIANRNGVPKIKTKRSASNPSKTDNKFQTCILYELYHAFRINLYEPFYIPRP